MTSISKKWSLTAATFGLLLCDFEHLGSGATMNMSELWGPGPLGPILDQLLLGAFTLFVVSHC